VEDALAGDTAEQRKLRQDWVRNYTWDVRTLQLSQTIAHLLSNGRH